MKIAVLTSGGDAPGMNACIRAIVRNGIYQGFEMFGVISGYQGLLDNKFIKLNTRDVGNIIQTGGTFLKTSRCKEFTTKAGIAKAVKNINDNGIDAVITIGGDGTFKGAIELSKFVNVIAVPGTIDNDMGYTDRTIGFDTAVNTVVSLVNNIRDTSSSHDRLTIVEVMGARCGDVALFSGVASGAEMIILPEKKMTNKQICDRILKKSNSGKKSLIIMLAEGAGHAGEMLSMIKSNINIDGRECVIGHIQRGGSPTMFDRVIASKLGSKAIELLSIGKSNLAVGLKNGDAYCLPINDALNIPKRFHSELYELNDVLTI